MPRRGGSGRGRRGGCGRSASSPAPGPGPGSAAACPPRQLAQRSPRLGPAPAMAVFLKGQVLRIKGSWPKLRTGGWAEQQQQQRQEEARFRGIAARPGRRQRSLPLADLRLREPGTRGPGAPPIVSPRPLPLAWGPAPQFSRDVVSVFPWEFSGHYGGVGWCQRPSEVLFFFL